MTEHPITPPPELVEKWAIASPLQANDENWAYELYIAHQAARWGADQELEACCEWSYHHLDRGPEWSMDLRTARRPKPPCLKEQALAELELLRGDANAHGLGFDAPAIRRALEQLND